MSDPDNGIISKQSRQSVDQTVEVLKGILQAKGITLFALVDHSGEAEKVGMKMPPTKLLIFGSPKGGTPLMIASPTVAIDLPLKVLVAEDAQGGVWVSYNSPAYLRQRHGLPADLLKNIAVVEALVAQISSDVWSHGAAHWRLSGSRLVRACDGLHESEEAGELSQCELFGAHAWG